MKIRLSGVIAESIVDGPGFRYVVFTQGCPHHCGGCHNPETWDFSGGRDWDTDMLFEEFKQNPLLKGITFSGGEPFCQPKPLVVLARQVHSIGKDVVTFTGFTYEQLLEQHDEDVDALLAETDLLIDGQFVLAQRNLELTFRGSENQRLIDMNKTRSEGHLVLREG